MNKMLKDFRWVGSEAHFVDQPSVLQLHHLFVGRYGGNSDAGQYKNEDGCLVWWDEKEDWEFVMLLDAHNTAESAEVILAEFDKEKSPIKAVLALPANHQTFKKLEEQILSIFQAEEFISICREVTGETACLIVVRKGKYVWWFSVGDCIVSLFHPELARLGQYQLNQRQFYEWVGQVNTFDEAVPCYTVGRRELRQGENHLFLTTDGLTECPNEPYATPVDIYNVFQHANDEESAIESMFKDIIHNGVRDSTTIVSWKINIAKAATIPSDQ